MTEVGVVEKRTCLLLLCFIRGSYLMIVHVIFLLSSAFQDTVFDPVALTCGHIFCYMCACSAASVTIVDGLKAAEPKEKCPLCREVSIISFSTWS